MIEMAGEFDPHVVYQPFSFIELRQIKAGLGNYLDKLDKYTDALQHITLVYELPWKDVMVVLGQILSDIEWQKVITEARKFAKN